MPRRQRASAPAPRAQLLALLEECKDHPEDDAPRLVLADWLQEHGDEHDAARGEYLRLCCQEARLPEGDPRRTELASRREALWQQQADAWVGSLRDWQPLPSERGLLQLRPELRTLASGRGAALTDTEAYAWVDTIALRTATAGGLAKLGQTQLLGTITFLDLSRRHVRAAGVRALVSSPQTARLTRLNLYENWIQDQGLAELVQSPHLGRLRDLDLGRNMLGSRSIVRLVKSPLLGQLRSLGLGDHDLRDESVVLLAGTPALAGLESLDLSSTRVGDEGARALADSPHAANLTELDLAGTRVTLAGVLALLNSPHLTRLSRLRFVFHGSDAVAAALASTPGLLRLRTLVFLGRTMSVQGLERLLGALEKGELTELFLYGNPLGDAGAGLLADWPPAARLTTLNLQVCDIGDAGAQALADSPYLTTLRVLRVIDNPIGPVGIKALKQRFGERVRFRW